MERGAIPYVKRLAWRDEILRLSDASGLPRRAVMLLVLDLWSWMDERHPRGFVPYGMPAIFVSILDGATPEFVRALEDNGWLLASDKGVAIPLFDRNLDRWLTKRAQILSVSRPCSVTLEQARINLDNAYA
jgi:hypothetical protein